MAGGFVNTDLPSLERRRLFNLCKNYVWEEPYLFREGADGIMRRCVPEHEHEAILKDCHEGEAGGYLSGKKTAHKVFTASFYWPTVFNDAQAYVKQCDRFQRVGNIGKKDEMPLNSNQVLELFDIWGIDFMALFQFLMVMSIS